MRLKNKTIATYFALILGVFGMHRFYLKGLGDKWGWLQLTISAVGLVGMRRIWALGQDDRLAWALVPFFGLSLFAACLAAIVFGLMPEGKWNAAYNTPPPESHGAGGSSRVNAGVSTGLTIFGVILALLLGTTALMSTIAYSGQKYFEAVLKTA